MVNSGTQILGKKDAQRILDIDVDLSQLYVGKTLTIQNFTSGQVNQILFQRGDDSISTTQFTTVQSSSTSYTLTSSDLNHFIRIQCVDKTGKTTSKTFYFSSVPVVYIDTKNGTTIEDLDVDCRMRVQGDSEFSEQYNGKAEIHVRGDSSAEFPTQLPYKIKLKKKTSLFGFGSNRHWVLVSNFIDNSLMRNMLATQLADVLGVSHMKMKHVVVILNGVNIGVYLLAQHIRVNENIVNIFNWEDEAEDRGYENDDFSWVDADSSIDVSGGYLYELDEGYDETTQFTTNGGIRVMLRRPEYSRSSRRMVNSEMEFWRRFELAMKSEDFTYDGDSLDDFMDISSYAKLMMVNIVLQNIDISTRSLFASKDINGKVVFGPIWDFDLSADSVVYENELQPNEWGIFRNSPQCIGLNLLKSQDVCSSLMSLYSSARTWLQQTVENFDQLVSEFSALGEMNDAARRTNTFNPSWNPSTFTLRGFQDDAEKLKMFLKKRLNVLETPFSSLQNLVDSFSSPYSKFPDWLCFTAKQENSTISLQNVAGSYKTSTDGRNWTNYTLGSTLTLENVGSKVYFSARTTNSTCYLNSTRPKFSMTGKIAASGSIQSLLDENCERMDAPTYCYNYMFRDCTSLTSAPELPATSLAEGCYYSMFHGCTSLMAAPALPATTLVSSCYSNMFSGCTSLGAAPALPATTLASYCYDYMFWGCASLTSAPELPATTLATNCYRYMFRDCTSLTSAPELPATTLATNCYHYMFQSCPKFSTVKMKTSMNGVYNTSTHGDIQKTVEYVL